MGSLPATPMNIVLTTLGLVVGGRLVLWFVVRSWHLLVGDERAEIDAEIRALRAELERLRRGSSR